MNVVKKISIVLLLTLNLFGASQINRLLVLTDHWPPYNIMEDSQLTGISVELFELLLEKHQSKISREDFKVTNWKIVYDTVKTLKNTVALTMTRNKIREKKFKWVGPIDIKQSGLIAKKSKNIKIKSLKDLRKYKIAVVRDYSTHQMLKKAGLKKNLSLTGGLFAVHKAIDNLVKGKVDLYSTSNINYIMKILDKKNFNANDYEIIKRYKKDQLYFAFNKKTDDKLINSMQEALDELKRNGIYDKIKSKYLH